MRGDIDVNCKTYRQTMRGYMRLHTPFHRLEQRAFTGSPKYLLSLCRQIGDDSRPFSFSKPKHWATVAKSSIAMGKITTSQPNTNNPVISSRLLPPEPSKFVVFA